MPDDIAVCETERYDSIESISVAHRVNSLAGVSGSTAYRAENDGVSQWIPLHFFLRVSKAALHVALRMMLHLNGFHYNFFYEYSKQYHA